MSDGRMLQVQKELDRLFSSLGHGMYVVDAQRRILLWNKSAESILGWTQEDALGRSCRDFIGHVDDEGNQLCDTECPLDTAMGSARTVFAGTVWGSSKSGEKVPVNVSCAPLFDDVGKPVGAVEVFSDMTREKNAERLKDSMVSVVAHELRTPLTSIKGYLELVMDGEAGELSAEQRGFLEVVQSSVEDLEELVNDLLDLGRLDSGHVTIHWEDLELEAMVRKWADFYTPLARERSLSMSVEADDVPVVTGDRQLLDTVISNLVSNAVKYTNEGGVEVRLSRERESVVLEVSDTGVGIPPEEQGRVLERFFRASTAFHTSSTGSGLGLSISDEIVRRHKGALWLESVPGSGSTFWVRLPAAGETTILRKAGGEADD